MAGAHEVDLFAPDALNEIFKQSTGLPRLINIICDNALLFGCAANMSHINRDIIRQVAHDMDINTLEEDDRAHSVLSTSLTDDNVPLSFVSSPDMLPADQHALQSRSSVRIHADLEDDTDRAIILQNTVLTEGNYWDNLLQKSSHRENDLVHIWQKAAKREAGRRLWRFVMIWTASISVLIVIGGSYFNLWSLPAIIESAVNMVTQQETSILSEERVKTREVVPSTSRSLQWKSTTDESESRAALGAVSTTPPSPAPAFPSIQPSLAVQERQVNGEKVKKVVVIRAGDTLSKILLQEYGEYTQAIVALVMKANPGLSNIHLLEVGQRLILPERPE